jgi:hypothetical protein
MFELIKVDYDKGETTAIAVYDTETEAKIAENACKLAYNPRVNYLVRPQGTLRQFSERLGLEQI